MAKDMFLSGGDYEASLLDMAHAVYLTQGQQHVLKLIKNVDEFSAFHGRPRPPLYEFFGDAAYSGVLKRVFFHVDQEGCKAPRPFQFYGTTKTSVFKIKVLLQMFLTASLILCSSRCNARGGLRALEGYHDSSK